MNTIEQIKAEIERLQQEALQSAATEKVEKRLAWQRQVHFYEGKASAYKSVLAFLDTLPKEKPNEDLEKEIDKFLDETGAPYFWCGDDEQKEWCDIIARHFYELGLKARKEDTK